MLTTELPPDIPCGLMDLGVDDTVIAVNDTLADWLGGPADGFAGRAFLSLMAMGARIAFETHVRPMLRMEGKVDELALDLFDSNGARVPFIANAREHRDASGTPTFTRFALFRAVDRRTYERSLRDARQMAEAAAAKGEEISALRERFIAVLGHDLRNPLAAVLSGLNRIERAGGTAAPELVNAMRHSADRSVALVDSVMDFARGRMGDGITIVRTPAPELAQDLERVLDEARSIPSHRDVLASWDISHPVTADIPRLLQLLANLVSNANHHGDDDADDPIRVEGHTTDTEFHLSITNRGAEIPPEVCARLFEPFVQGEGSRSARGLGLGLFIVNQIAHAHDGRMEVVCGDETITFTFTMPREGPAA